ncbi:MAG: glutaconate CoA-transferase, subunit [Verrucomicrobiota bacterium]|jgi:hypothetical protein
MTTEYSADEIMTISAARMLQNGAVCFVGIGLPSKAANLARLSHAPDIVLIYESGPIGAKPSILPLSIGDGELSVRLIQRYRPARSLLSGCREGALMSVSWVLLRSIALLTLILLLSDHTTGPLCDCRERVAPRKLPGLPVRS